MIEVQEIMESRYSQFSYHAFNSIEWETICSIQSTQFDSINILKFETARYIEQHEGGMAKYSIKVTKIRQKFNGFWPRLWKKVI